MTDRPIRVATALLIASGGIVSVAVWLGGDAGRMLNGVGGIGWLIAAVLSVAGLSRTARWRRGVLNAVVATIGLA